MTQSRVSQRDILFIKSKCPELQLDIFLFGIGLIIDQPSQGSGNSNWDNTAHRFFSVIGQASEITGVNEKLIQNTITWRQS